MTGSIAVPRLPLRFIGVAAAHVGLFYIVSDALRFEVAPEPPPMIGEILESPLVLPGFTDPEPVPEPFERETITVDVPDPPRPILNDETPEPLADPRERTSGMSARPDGSAEIVARFVPVRADPNRPLTRAPYPAASIRLEEQGVVELSIHVLSDGRIADVRVVKSSGHPRLDRAAVEEARRHWRLRPAIRGDEPIDAWGSFRVVFRLDGR